MKLTRHPYLLLTLASLLWSANFIVGRAVHGSVPPVALAFCRWAGASLLILYPAWPHLRRDWPAIRRAWPILLLLSALGIAAFNTLVYTGLQTTLALNALLMQSTMPVLIVAMSFLLFRERVSTRQALGIALSLAGATTIILRGDPGALGTLTINHGDLLVMIAVLCYAAYSVLLRLRPAVHPLSFVAVTFAAGTLMLVPFFLGEIHGGRTLEFNLVTLLAVGYVAIFPSIVAYLCFNRGVELVGANRAGLFIHLMPVFGSLMAIAFLGESFRWFHGTGIVLIAAGILLATRR
jgi:drug/metabolite transporter (DMT)-like permease